MEGGLGGGAGAREGGREAPGRPGEVEGHTLSGWAEGMEFSGNLITNFVFRVATDVKWP